jgi:predicted nucleic acid-binding protein
VTAFLDTNILLYVVLDSGPSDRKKTVARRLLHENDNALSIQVVNEFIVQATHARRSDRLSLETAISFVRGLRRFPIQELTFPLFEAATTIMQRGGFSWWDATIIAAAQAQGCDVLYTEDMQHGRIIDGLRIVDPFR